MLHRVQAGSALVVGALVYMLLLYTPDPTDLTNRVQSTQDAIIEMLVSGWWAQLS